MHARALALAPLLAGCTVFFPFSEPEPTPGKDSGVPGVDAEVPGDDGGHADAGDDAGGSSDCNPALYRDTDILSAPPPGQVPATNVWLDAPIFGTRYLVIPDESLELVEDSEAASFSRDSTKFILATAGQHPVVFEMADDVEPAPLPELGECRSWDARWSATNDDVVYCVRNGSDTVIAEFTVGDDVPFLYDLPFHAGVDGEAIDDLTISADDSRWAFDVNGGGEGYVVNRIGDGGSLVATYDDDEDLNQIFLDRSGLWALAISNNESTPMVLWSVGDDRARPLDEMSRWALGHEEMYWFAFTGTLSRASLSIPLLPERLFLAEAEGVDVAVPAGASDWVLVAFGDRRGVQEVPYENELVAVSRDPLRPWAVRLLHHGHSSAVDMEIRVSPDGQWALITTDFGTPNTYVVLVDLPDICGPRDVD